MLQQGVLPAIKYTCYIGLHTEAGNERIMRSGRYT